MTREEQQIAIAELCGWKVQNADGDIDVEDGSLMGDNPINGDRDMVPDYPSDLNAMHEAEKTLAEDQCYIYNAHICKNIGDWTPQSRALNWTFHGTAAQRAEAFLRTLNLWT